MDDPKVDIETSGFVIKTQYSSDKSDLEKKINRADKNITDITGLVKTTVYNAKITEIEGKIPNITGLTTAVALTVVENKIPNISDLAKKQIITQQYQTLKVKILLRLIIPNLRVIYLMQR